MKKILKNIDKIDFNGFFHFLEKKDFSDHNIVDACTYSIKDKWFSDEPGHSYFEYFDHPKNFKEIHLLNKIKQYFKYETLFNLQDPLDGKKNYYNLEYGLLKCFLKKQNKEINIITEFVDDDTNVYNGLWFVKRIKKNTKITYNYLKKMTLTKLKKFPYSEEGGGIIGYQINFNKLNSKS